MSPFIWICLYKGWYKSRWKWKKYVLCTEDSYVVSGKTYVDVGINVLGDGRCFNSFSYRKYLKEDKIISLEEIVKRKIVQSIKHLPTKIELYENFYKYLISKFYKTAEPYLTKN